MEIKFGCCFCNEGMDAEEAWEVGLFRPDSDRPQQQFWTHPDCFYWALHERYYVLPGDIEEVEE
jgi:hypothetical protein